MVILNPYICSTCLKELQPQNIGVDISDEGELIRVCLFCGARMVMKDD